MACEQSGIVAACSRSRSDVRVGRCQSPRPSFATGATPVHVRHYDVLGALRKTCAISTEQWFIVFHKTSLDAAADPCSLCCPCCEEEFKVYEYSGERFRFAGQLEGSVRVLAEKASGDPDSHGSD